MAHRAALVLLCIPAALFVACELSQPDPGLDRPLSAKDPLPPSCAGCTLECSGESELMYVVDPSRFVLTSGATEFQAQVRMNNSIEGAVIAELYEQFDCAECEEGEQCDKFFERGSVETGNSSVRNVNCFEGMQGGWFCTGVVTFADGDNGEQPSARVGCKICGDTEQLAALALASLRRDSGVNYVQIIATKRTDDRVVVGVPGPDTMTRL